MADSKTLTGLWRLALVACVVMSFQVQADAGDFDPWTQTARYELEHRIDLTEWTFAAEGAVRLWLPMPADNAHQRLISKTIESPWKYRETQDANGNRFIYIQFDATQRTRGEIVMRFVVERSPHAGIPKADARSGTALDPRRSLAATSKIPLVGRIKADADKTGAGLTSDAARIRAYYDHVTKTMKYAKYGQGWGRGDAAWACDAKYGNCTDFHSVIIGMCRSQNIPARFVIGFPMPRDKKETKVTGYHCWAEAYDGDFGWIPMDASDAWKTKRFDDYFGRLPSDRVEYVVGRDLVLEPPQSNHPLNFVIYPYAEVNGSPVADVPWTMHARWIEAN